MHTITSSVRFRMEDDRSDTLVSLLLRDIYRLGRADEPSAIRWFQELVRSGYTPHIHRGVLIALDAQDSRKVPR